MIDERPLGSRCAVSTIFFVNGAVIASWVPHVPSVKARHGLSDGELGLGIANIIPLLFSGAARMGGAHAGAALAAVATTGYLGFLAGPPLIGLAADLVGLPAALGIVSGCCALVALGSGVLVSRTGNPLPKSASDRRRWQGATTKNSHALF